MDVGVRVFVRAYAQRDGAARVTVLEDAAGNRELRIGGSPAWRNCNPGNLRPSRYSKGQIGEAWGFAVFANEDAGLAAMKALLRRPLYAALTLEKAIYMYAPPSDNNPSHTYATYVIERSGVGLNYLMKTLTDAQLEAVVAAMTVFERSVSGRVRRMMA